jgi:hypothetical protein
MPRAFFKLCTIQGLAVLVLLHATAGAYVVTGAQRQDPASIELKHFKVEKLSLLDALLQLGQEQGIPLGIEYIDLKAVTDPISVDMGPATVAQVFDAILRQQPGYSWSVRGGVVCISHLGVPAGGLNLLDHVLTDFSIQKISITEAGNVLYMTLDKELHPGITGWGGSYAGDISRTEVGPFAMHNVTVREALNRMVAQAGDAAWVVQVPPGNLDELPSYGLWRIIQYRTPPELYGPFFRGILRYVKPDHTPKNPTR